MDQYDHLEPYEPLVQINLSDQKVSCASELLDAAKRAQVHFELVVQKLLGDDPSLDPSDVIILEGKPVMQRDNTPFKVLTLGPMKELDRITQKARRELGGDFSRILDVLRCSVVVFTEDQLDTVALILEAKKKQRISRSRGENLEVKGAPGHRADKFFVARLKNRFKEPPYRGHRDALYNIVVNCVGLNHVCELQLHLAELVALNAHTHKYYEYFRTCFHGSGAEEARMEALRHIEGCEGDVDIMVDSVLRGSDLTQLNHLAVLMDDLMGDEKMSLLIRERIFELDEGSLVSRRNYGLALRKAGKFAQAESVLKQVLDLAVHQWGKSHPNTRAAMNDLARVLKDQGKLTEAEQLCQNALNCKTQLGHSDTLALMVEIASLLQNQQGKLDEAELLLKRALAKRRQLSNSHPDTIECVKKLAKLLQIQGKLVEAEPLFREALVSARRRDTLELESAKKPLPIHPETLTLINDLASLLQDLGRLDQAKPLFKEALDGARKRHGNLHPTTLSAIQNLASLRQKQGKKLEKAELLFQEALTLLQDRLGNHHLVTLNAMDNLASVLKDQGKFSEAERVYQEALEGRRALNPPETISTRFSGC